MNFIRIILLSISLFGCQTTDSKNYIQETNSYGNTPEELAKLNAKKHRTLTHNTLPILSFAVGSPAHIIDIFLTPSCPDCILLFSTFMEGGAITAPAYQNSTVNFIFVPRNLRDYTTIKTLMCVGPERFDESVLRHFKAMHDIVKSISSNKWLILAEETSKEVVQKMGVGYMQLSNCLRRTDVDELIYAQWLVGMNNNPLKRWPQILLDQQPMRLTNAKTLANILLNMKGN